METLGISYALATQAIMMGVLAVELCRRAVWKIRPLSVQAALQIVVQIATLLPVGMQFMVVDNWSAFFVICALYLLPGFFWILILKDIRGHHLRRHY